MTEPDFQLIGYLELLAAHEVHYLIIGGVGARLQGSGVSTQDLDIMIDPDPDNIEKLVAGLNSLDPAIQPWGSPAFSSTDLTASDFKTPDPVRIRTRLGILDVLPELPGVGYFGTVLNNARTYGFGDLKLIVADISDIRRSKEVADRTKDLHALDAIKAAEERIRQVGDPYELPRERFENEPDGDENG